MKLTDKRYKYPIGAISFIAIQNRQTTPAGISGLPVFR